MKFFKPSYVFITLMTIFLSFGLFSQTAKDEKNEEALARVAIADFIDNTGTRNYEYLKGSIADAMDKFMQERFKYARIDAGKVNRAILSKKRGYENFDGFSYEDLKEIAQSVQADVVIYGYYELDKETGEIVLYTKIYLAFAEVSVDIETIRSKVDSSLFQVVNVIAQKLVDKIEQMSASAKKDESGENKIILTRESLAKGLPKVWPPSEWNDMQFASDEGRKSFIMVNNLTARVFYVDAVMSNMQEITEFRNKKVQSVHYYGGYALCVDEKLMYYDALKGVTKTLFKCEKEVVFSDQRGSIFILGKADSGVRNITEVKPGGEEIARYKIPYENKNHTYYNRYTFEKDYLVQFIYQTKKSKIFHYDGSLAGEIHHGVDYALKPADPGYAASPNYNVILYNKDFKEIKKIKFPVKNRILAFDIDMKKKQVILYSAYYIHYFDIREKEPRLLREEKLSAEINLGIKDIHFTRHRDIFRIEYENGGEAYFEFSKRNYRLYHYVFNNSIGIPADYEINSYKTYNKRIVGTGGFIEFAKLYIDRQGMLVVAGKNNYDLMGDFKKFKELLKRDRYLRDRSKNLTKQPGLLASVLDSAK